MEHSNRRTFFTKIGTGLSLVALANVVSCQTKAIAPKLGDVYVPEGLTPSVFTKIIRGEVPVLKIYEDQYTFAFFPREQLNIGHTLVVPKIQVDSFLDVPEPYYSTVFQSAKKLGKAIGIATQCLRVGTLIHGLEVPHFHYHVLPMYTPQDLCTIKPVNHDQAELIIMQKKIIALLG